MTGAGGAPGAYPELQQTVAAHAKALQLLEAERFGVIGPQIVQTLTTFQEALTGEIIMLIVMIV